jgi:DNA-binding YbaB/EbfC family protein
MFDKMKDLMEMKRQADRLKRELDAAQVESQAIPGIKITINGSQTFQSIEIDETLLRPENRIRFQGDLLKSVNAAIRQSQQVAAQKMKDVLPGMPGF